MKQYTFYIHKQIRDAKIELFPMMHDSSVCEILWCDVSVGQLFSNHNSFVMMNLSFDLIYYCYLRHDCANNSSKRGFIFVWINYKLQSKIMNQHLSISLRTHKRYDNNGKAVWAQRRLVWVSLLTFPALFPFLT